MKESDVGVIRDLARVLRETADRLEKEDYGGLTGVALVVDAAPGIFKEDKPMTAAWVSMQGGRRLYGGLWQVAMDVAALRDAKGKKVQ